jgi:hypothetical protein
MTRRRPSLSIQSIPVCLLQCWTSLMDELLGFGNVLGSAWQARSAAIVASCFRCSTISACVNAAAQVRPMPRCVRQRNKACTMAGDELVDACCVAGGTIAAQSATRASTNAAVMLDRCIVAIATTSRVQVLSFCTCSWSAYPCWCRRGQCSPRSGGNSQVPRRPVVT